MSTQFELISLIYHSLLDFLAVADWLFYATHISNGASLNLQTLGLTLISTGAVVVSCQKRTTLNDLYGHLSEINCNS